MKQPYLLRILCISTLWIVAIPGVKAEEVDVGDRPKTNIPLLSNFEQPVTTLDEWDTRIAQSAVIQVTGVQVNATDQRLDVILNATAPLENPATYVEGNVLILDIPNARLTVPEGDEVQSVNPVAGIALVAVSNLLHNRVRVAITGTNEPPVGKVRTSAEGLVIGVSIAPETEAEAEAIEILVTAQRTEQDIEDVPISITVLTQEEIEDANITDLEGIAQNTPNFSVFSASGSRYFNYYSVRGLSNNNFTSRDAVGFYVDDVPYDYGGFITQDFHDIERVEVLRGPQNTLYGRSAQAGVVNIITRRPTNEFEFNGTTSYSNYNDLNVRASVSGPLLEDRLFYRVSGSYGRRDGYFKNIFLDNRLDDQSGGNSRGQLLWTPSENWEILLNTSFDDYRDGGSPLVSVDDNPFEIAQDVNGFTNLNANTQSLRIAYTDPNFRITSITTRRFSRQDIETDLDFSPVRAGRFTNIFDSTVVTQELRLQSPEDIDSPIQWIWGGYFESRTFNTQKDGFNFDQDASLLFGDIAIPGGSLLRSADVDETILATYGQVSYRPIEPLTLTAGLRYESSKSTLNRFERVLTLPDGSTTTVLAFSEIEQDGDILLPRFTADYRFNPNLMIYGSIARGYRPGGVNYRPDNEVSLTFDPERSWNYEVGLKSSWLNDRLAVNFAFFHNPIDDYQVIVSDPFTALPLEVANAGVQLTGFELEMRATPFDGLDLIAGLGFVNAEFTDYRDRFTGQSFNGNQLPFVPDVTYNLAVQYRDPTGLFARAELVGLGTTYFDEANTLKQDPFAIINAQLGYEFDNYGIYLFGNNIFNVEYLTAAFGIVGSQSGQYGVPATYGIQFRARF